MLNYKSRFLSQSNLSCTMLGKTTSPGKSQVSRPQTIFFFCLFSLDVMAISRHALLQSLSVLLTAISLNAEQLWRIAILLNSALSCSTNTLNHD